MTLIIIIILQVEDNDIASVSFESNHQPSLDLEMKRNEMLVISRLLPFLQQEPGQLKRVLRVLIAWRVYIK